MSKRVVLILLGVLVVAGIAIQFVPVNRANPPVTASVTWNSPETKALWDRACRDCHSNETVWPPYAYVAPASWLIVRHVSEGRREVNVSQPLRGPSARLGREMGEKISNGEMPTRDYILLHPEANLSQAEKRALIAGLQATFGGR